MNPKRRSVGRSSANLDAPRPVERNAFAGVTRASRLQSGVSTIGVGPTPAGNGALVQLKLVSAAQVRAKHCAEGSVEPREATFNAQSGPQAGGWDFMRRPRLGIVKILVIGSTRPQGR